MKLQELTALSPTGFDGWICVPRGSISPDEIMNCWVFQKGIEAAKATTSERGTSITRRHHDYLSYYTTGNGLYVLLQVTYDGLSQLHNHGNRIYAFNITEKSCREAGLRAWRASKEYQKGALEPRVFQVPNSDPAFFDEVDEVDEDLGSPTTIQLQKGLTYKEALKACPWKKSYGDCRGFSYDAKTGKAVWI